MTASPLPADPSEVARLSDVARLAEIARLGLDREEQSQHLRGIVDDVAAHLDQPWAWITIFLDDTQVFAATHGDFDLAAKANGVPNQRGLDPATFRDGEPVAFADLLLVEAYRENPNVTEYGSRNFVGVPLISRSGFLLGVLCASGTQPREYDAAEVAFLQEKAAEALVWLSPVWLSGPTPA